MQTSLKRTFFLTVVTIFVTETALIRSLSATEYTYPTVDQSDIDNRGLPCYMQTEEGSTLDLSRVCKQSDPQLQDGTVPTEMMSEPDGSMLYEMQESPDPYSSSEPPSEDRY